MWTRCEHEADPRRPPAAPLADAWAAARTTFDAGNLIGRPASRDKVLAVLERAEDHAHMLLWSELQPRGPPSRSRCGGGSTRAGCARAHTRALDAGAWMGRADGARGHLVHRQEAERGEARRAAHVGVVVGAAGPSHSRHGGSLMIHLLRDRWKILHGLCHTQLNFLHTFLTLENII